MKDVADVAFATSNLLVVRVSASVVVWMVVRADRLLAGVEV